MRWQPGWAELTRVYVRPEHRGAGGGAALIAAIEAYAQHWFEKTLAGRVDEAARAR
ncbi:GNAT family N-acetyltransferase [Micromonospora aurantiaca (nom. illeg.)]|uniref:GNAT family N-acetyltransferase n=1 Tax=Micromonospora aurantiaca (nom. illeg.) TaxID=47850 RepID=UPI003F49B6F0